MHKKLILILQALKSFMYMHSLAYKNGNRTYEDKALSRIKSIEIA